MKGELKNQQIVIWFKFNKELIRVVTELSAKDVSNDFIIGATKPVERERIRKRFKAGKFRVLLAQIKCGKFGIDLSTASVVAFYSNSFEYEERIQCEDRIISPNKKEPILILDLLTKDTVDEDIYKALRRKGMNSKIFMSKIVENLKERIGKC